MAITRTIGSASLVGGGAALMYFLDPDRGRARRGATRDQVVAALRRRVRRTSRIADQKVRYAEGHLEGAMARAEGAGHYRPESEADLREHLRQVLSELSFPTSNVTVDVADGVATLRGQVVSTKEMTQATAALAEVPGVESVESFLHLPGEPAPNKAAVSGGR